MFTHPLVIPHQFLSSPCFQPHCRSSHPLPYTIPVFSTRSSISSRHRFPLRVFSSHSLPHNASSPLHPIHSFELVFHLFPRVFHCLILYHTTQHILYFTIFTANISLQVQKARASAQKPFPVVATRLTPKLSTPVTKLGDSIGSLRISKASGSRIPRTTRTGATIPRTRTTIRPILKKNTGIPNGPRKRVHFEFDNKTVAALRYIVAYEPRCDKYIRTPGQTNTPHVAGAVRIISSSNGVLSQERFDGEYFPPMYTGTFGSLGHPSPDSPGFDDPRHCRNCIIGAQSGSFLWQSHSDQELRNLSSREYSTLWRLASLESYQCEQHDPFFY